ncbi:hypothetical protein [Streptomyces jeddahensis]|uniref:Uncharacterized protein n=1 Tax=Streptomyces jeddahensis TaxID=1716141 RepID=A0A177HYB0_9ACTN|nr:hypothetical protein [Streptomyces jeddahensis]OAH15833.1 hypothetical protein STSP_08370 [Streptomyces jeddahensis]
MPASVLEEDCLLDVADMEDKATLLGAETTSLANEGAPAGRDGAPLTSRATRLNCPSCGSVHVAQVLGDNGGVSFVCTACGHSWS